jgi:hypothetical protein
MQKIREIAAYLRSLGQNPFSRGTYLLIEQNGKARDLVRVVPGEEALHLLGHKRGQFLLLPVVQFWFGDNGGDENG